MSNNIDSARSVTSPFLFQNCYSIRSKMLCFGFCKFILFATHPPSQIITRFSFYIHKFFIYLDIYNSLVYSKIYVYRKTTTTFSLELALNDVAEREIAILLSLASVLSPGERTLLTHMHFETLLLLCRLAKSPVPAATTEEV